MLFYALLLILSQYVYAEPPSCLSCKWVIPHPRGMMDYHLCGFYKNRYEIKGQETIIYEFASHCRNNESMCGSDGHMFQDATHVSPSSITEQSQTISCCQSDEKEQLEREMFEMFQKLK